MTNNNTLSRLDMENKQLRLQLSNALDQAKKYSELNKKGSDAYNDLAKKVKNFCSQITSTEYAKRQIMQGGGGNMSLDDMLNFAIEEYEKQRKEFQHFSAQLSMQIDKRDAIIEDLQRQISIYEIQLAQPTYISNTPLEQEDNTNEQALLNPNDFDDEFLPIGNTNEPPLNIEPPLPNIDDEFAGLPSGLPPGISTPPTPPMVNSPNNFQNKQIDNSQQKNKKPVVTSLDEEDFIEVVPRQKAEILPTKNNKGKQNNKNENPDGGEYVTSTIDSIPSDTKSGVKESQRQAIKMKIAAEKKEKEQMLMLSDISPLIIETKSNQIWYDIISLIGEKGISQRPKIEELLSSKENGSGKTSLSTQIIAMQKAGLITRENINTGYRRFIVLDLAPVGIRVFEEIFGKSPVESEVRRLTRENATKEHGYLIEDTRTILLKEFGYAHVSIDRRKNTIALNNGKKYIPDLVASIDGKVWDYIEVERGTHTDGDFGEKLEKMFMVTRTFHFIAQNKDVLDIIVEKTEKWLLTKDIKSINGLTIKYSTLSHLAKRNWLIIKKY